MIDETPKRPGQACLGWWGSRIRPKDDTADAKRNRAALRRVATPVDALTVEAVHDLHAKLNEAGYDLRNDTGRLMLVATALVHVKTHERGRRAALAFGELVGERRRLGGIRFETLIRAKKPAELARPLARALSVIGGRADVAELSQSLFYWSDDTRASWCFDYYGAAYARPDFSNLPEINA